MQLHAPQTIQIHRLWQVQKIGQDVSSLSLFARECVATAGFEEVCGE